MAKKSTQTITAYKGFNTDWTCRGFQFEIGKSYEHDGEVAHCESGFHACEHPLDCFNYYEPYRSKYALVEVSGDVSREPAGDSKIAAAKIEIKAELQIHDMVSAAVKYVFDRAKKVKGSTSKKDQGAASAMGDWGAASATGNRAAAMASGYQGRAKGKEGNALFLCERNDDYEIIAAWAGIAGKDGIKPDTWYMLQGGKPMEPA